MCSFGYFGNITNTHKINLISAKNAQKLYIEKYANRDKLDFQLKHVSGTELVTRGQQVFEDGREINPIEIKVGDNSIRNFFDKYKNSKVKFKLIEFLIVNSVDNDTEKIFLHTTGLKSAKYALLNDEYKQIIGIVNLQQIENWHTLKQRSKWVDITFEEQIENKNTSHPLFSFISNNKEDVLSFSLKLVGSDNKLIKLAEGEKKFPILEFIIEFVK